MSSAIYSLGFGVNKVVLADFGQEPIVHTALVYFDHLAAGKENIAKDMYSKLRNYEKNGTLGRKMHLIPGALIKTSVRWFYNRALDPSLEWTSVVCRGLSQYKNPKEIQNKLGRYSLRVEVPRYINGQLCTLIVVPSLIDAKKIIFGNKSWHLAKFMDIHPHSSVFKRPDTVIPLFFNEYSKTDISSFHMINNAEVAEEDMMSPISSSEEGEITFGENEKEEVGYEFFELAGEFITKSQEISYHSGVVIKTSFNSRLLNGETALK